ncbi:MAG TPA: carbon starvation protein A [Gemmataceae bacterium]|jgi:carbon starvation protein|nr:carbon starvation protein A [Gemmataceae bacterium]
MLPLANAFFETRTLTSGEEQHLLRAMPVMLGVLCVLAIAYRFYSAFLAAKVAALDDSRRTPAHEFNDGQNYHPTNRWVLFGHHFAAISGAGPLIGPVLAMQYGYAPGLLWLLIGVCLAGAVQDMLVMAASVRRGGKSLAEIARIELGKPASLIASLAILLIVVMALAGLAFVVVKALGGEDAKLPAGTVVITPNSTAADIAEKTTEISFPPGCVVRYPGTAAETKRPEAFRVRLRGDGFLVWVPEGAGAAYTLPKGSVQIIPGSSWGTFTIAMTIPIALFVGLWMYRIRKGRIVEASIIGGVLTLGAVVLGGSIPGSSWERYFDLDQHETIVALGVYGFIAATLPVWLLLTPRDYLSSFMKIGTLILLVVGVIVANPTLQHPPINETFQNGGPTFGGNVFPFVFICVMCGAISGFHALVSSGTTPKMIDRERDIRPIGYGAMLTEGLVGVVALIAAAAMPPQLYYSINVDVEKVPQYQEQLDQMYEKVGATPAANDKMQKVGVRDMHQLNLAEAEELVGGESLRGRTGGAVTLAVSMATILTSAFDWTDGRVHDLMKYWYHFAIMFEALFILTTIDAGTRIARYLFQETLGKVYAPFARPNWLPGALLATALVTLGWGSLVWSGEIRTIWPMFGIANQLLAVLALAIVTTWLVNSGRGRYAFVTIPPMLFVMSTTLSAGAIMANDPTFRGMKLILMLFVIASICVVVFIAIARWLQRLLVWRGGGPPLQDRLDFRD